MFFHEEGGGLSRFRDNDSSSIISSTSSVISMRFLPRTTTRDSLDLSNRPRCFTLTELCDFIAEHPSLQSARIESCSCYAQRIALFVPRRFLLLQLRRPERKDFWLRLDRRASGEVGPAEFTLALGTTRGFLDPQCLLQLPGILIVLLSFRSCYSVRLFRVQYSSTLARDTYRCS